MKTIRLSMMLNKVFVDTSWFKALSDPMDLFYPKSHEQLVAFPKSIKLITTNYVLDESFTLIRVKSNLDAALDFRNTLLGMSDILKVVRVLPQDDTKAWDWFPKNWSKLSFTDCTSFAVMQRLDLKDVATFDEHFSRAGFNMLS